MLPLGFRSRWLELFEGCTPSCFATGPGPLKARHAGLSLVLELGRCVRARPVVERVQHLGRCRVPSPKTNVFDPKRVCRLQLGLGAACVGAVPDTWRISLHCCIRVMVHINLVKVFPGRLDRAFHCFSPFIHEIVRVMLVHELVDAN